MSTTGKPDIKLAGTESKDKMYEPKHKKRLVRVLTVVAYVFSVSLAAITLSLFYIFIYNPDRPAGKITTRGSHFYNNTSYMLRPEDGTQISRVGLGLDFPYFPDRVMNRTWLAPEEPRALPVQIGEPPRINQDIAHLNSEESANWETQEIVKAMRGKRSIRKVLNVLKLVGAS